MGLQAVLPEVNQEHETHSLKSEPFLSVVREQVSRREITSHRLQNLYTYRTWLRAHEQELESIKELAKVTEELAKIEHNTETPGFINRSGKFIDEASENYLGAGINSRLLLGSDRDPRLVELKNLEYTYTVKINDARVLLKGITDSLLETNPLEIRHDGSRHFDIGQCFQQLELMELLRGDLNRRNRQHLKEATELIHYGLVHDAKVSIGEYEKSLSGELPDAASVSERIRSINEAFKSPDPTIPADQQLDMAYSKLPFSLPASEDNDSINNYKALLGRFTAESFAYNKFRITANSDILTDEVTSLLLDDTSSEQENQARTRLPVSLWDIKGPWDQHTVALEPDMRLAHTLHTTRKRIASLLEAYAKMQHETEHLPERGLRSAAREEATRNLWAHFHHGQELLDQEISALVAGRITTQIASSPDQQKTTEALFIISALSKTMNVEDERAYQSFLANADANETSHLPTSTRIFEYLEQALENGTIMLPDHILREASVIMQGDSEPDSVFQNLKEQYGVNFEEAFDTYESLKAELEPYNAAVILLNQIPSHSPSHPLAGGNYLSSDRTQNRSAMALTQVEKSLSILMDRLSCDHTQIEDILLEFRKANPGNSTVEQYTEQFRTRFRK